MLVARSSVPPRVMPRTVNWSVALESVAFLTYSQYGPADGVSDIQASSQCFEYIIILVAHERHEDGGHHYHVLVAWESHFKANDVRIFDVGGCHPNFKSVRGDGNINRVLEQLRLAQFLPGYCLKDGDYYGDPEVFRRDAPKRSQTSIWTEIVSAESAGQFLQLARELAPKEYGLNYDRLVSYCRAHYDKPAEYVPRHVDFVVPSELDDWVNVNVSNAAPEQPERPRALCLIGRSRLGKTEWARSLGKHSYFASLFNIDDFDGSADYAVMDDIDIKFFPNYKGWFGAQKRFCITGKYARHRTVDWGKPMIWCTNDDPRQAVGIDQDWFSENPDFVIVQEPFLLGSLQVALALATDSPRFDS
ncbi:replication associated protein [Faeces associated gemycircularvirus 11]|uniref:Replication associated protein n=1 Tax=Faeces associated gemycircularvirus 11 TaxID=1391026 RepID=T1YTA5_9VIRU|nr:replication associated protein [Faeces associated gemycircularvirus 11]AGU67649.1 replication associated protein [Faeces associated gemycircularvirus 11]